MGVFSVREDTEGSAGGANRDRMRTNVRTFTVQTHFLTDDANVVKAALAIPRMWTPYVSPDGTFADFGCWVESVDATRVKKGSTIWRVVVKYSNKLNLPDINMIENPVQRPADISWDTRDSTVPMLVDADGVNVLNSAGDPYDPPIEQNVKTLVLRITRNQLTYDALNYLDFEDSVNKLPFMGFKRRAVKCAHIKGSRGFENGIYYWKVEMQFEMRREMTPPNSFPANGKPWEADESLAWIRWVLDRGFRQKKVIPPAAEASLVACLDPITKQVLSTPALLNGFGAQLAPGGKPLYFGHRPFKDKDFNALQLI